MQVVASYEPFSQQPEYIEANREFLRSLPVDSVRRVLDLACGTGTLSELFLELQPLAGIVGIDLSRESLEIARELFLKKKLLVEDYAGLNAALASGKGSVQLIEGSAYDLTLDSQTMDLVLMGNAIHLLPDKDKLLQGVGRVLCAGGLFAFNSCFFVGTYPEGTESVYTEWIKEALAIVTSKDQELRQSGEVGILRQRGKGGRAFSKGWMSPEQWREALKRNGFDVLREYQRTVMLTQHSLETIGAYAGFAEVMLSGYPVEVASEALQEAAGRAFRNLEIKEIPRLWLEITAFKK